MKFMTAAVFLTLTVFLSAGLAQAHASKVQTAPPVLSQDDRLSEAASESRQLSHDFYVTTIDTAKPSRNFNHPLSLPWSGSRADCEANFRRAVCETTANTDEITWNYRSVSCSSTSAQHVPKLLALYDETPDKMRASLCTLDKIFISDSITSVAFASAIKDRMGRNVGGYIGMRKQTFLGEPTTAQIVTWKEQLPFGGSQTFLANDPRLVQLNYDLKMSTLQSDGLFYVLMHELAHLIDFKNEVNSQWGSSDWSILSWSGSDPDRNADFYLRDRLCYYDCRRHIAPSEAKAIYTSLQKSGFVTTYAASNPFEDFAEFWTWHLLLTYKSPHYTIEVPGEALFEMDKVFTDNPLIKSKIEFIDKMWNSPSLKVAN